MIVLMAGLPGTGKTTLAREMAARTGGRVLSKDEIRHAIFSVDEIEYSTRQDDFCLQLMLRLPVFFCNGIESVSFFWTAVLSRGAIKSRMLCTPPNPWNKVGAFSSACAPKSWRGSVSRNRLKVIQLRTGTSNFIWKCDRDSKPSLCQKL
jgi:hypothetical protein